MKIWYLYRGIGIKKTKDGFEIQLSNFAEPFDSYYSATLAIDRIMN